MTRRPPRPDSARHDAAATGGDALAAVSMRSVSLATKRRFAGRGPDASASGGPGPGRPLLDDITLDIPQGAAVAIAGPDRAPGSALLAVLATLIRPTSGSASVLGFDVRRQRRKAASMIGYASASTLGYRDLAVEDYLRFFAGAYRVSTTAWSESIEGFLELSELTDVRKRLVGELSELQQQQLNLARAMLHHPRLILLDEPGRDLDDVARSDLALTLATLRDLDTTLVVALRRPTWLSDVFTHIVALEGGRLAETGDSEGIAGEWSGLDLDPIGRTAVAT